MSQFNAAAGERFHTAAAQRMRIVMAGLEPRDERKIFVIVLKEILIAQDLAAMIQAARPGATTIVARSLPDCIGQLEPGSSIDIAFVDSDPVLYDRSRLATAVDESGGSVVFLGQERGSARFGQVSGNWSVLSYPFSDEDVMQIMTAHRA